MKGLRSGVKRFWVSVKQKTSERTVAPQQSPRVTRPASPTRRRSIFGLGALGSSSKKKREDAETAEIVVQQQSDRRKRKVSRLDEHKQQLGEEQDNLDKDISLLNERIARRIARLEDLKAQDDKEKWEDELFETRLKELQSARAIIGTRSSASGADVLRQIEELNHDIAAIAALGAETRTGDAQQVSLENVKHYLGEGFLVVFRGLKSAEGEKRLVQAILQVFLVHSCAEFISSWHIGNPTLSTLLDRLYDRIRSKEEQMVAGKWRQITFAQLPQGPNTESLRQYAKAAVNGLLEIASYAGWGGDSQEIQRRVLRLMEKAEEIRMNVKTRIISADLQPSAAADGDRYVPSWMEASHYSGMERVENPERCSVLGSLTLGLKVRKTRGDEVSDFNNSEVKTHVLFKESFLAPVRLTSR